MHLLGCAAEGPGFGQRQKVIDLLEVHGKARHNNAICLW
jgi:hypothetical protein